MNAAVSTLPARLAVTAASLAWLSFAAAVGAQEPPASPAAAPAATQEPPSAPAPAPPPAVSPDQSGRMPFDEWLKGMRKEAVAAGIHEATVDAAFAGLEPLPVVVERDKTQAEFTLSLDQYLTRRLTKKLVTETARAAATHRALLARVTTRYGVPARVVVSVWALESNLGRFAGVRPTIGTLATLAWEGRRGVFFRSQLLDALRIVDRGDMELARLKGSWAGAMGQVQFMPSSYLQYAQDFDGDGRKDIWGSPADVFASIANYLREKGWHEEQGWGREVVVPTGRDAITAAAPLRTEGCRAEQEMSAALSLDRWRALGVKTRTGSSLPHAPVDASLLVTGPRAFLLYPNYAALLQYNCAHAYALSVGLLSDRLAGAHASARTAAKPKTKKSAPPKPKPAPTAPKATRPDGE